MTRHLISNAAAAFKDTGLGILAQQRHDSRYIVGLCSTLSLQNRQHHLEAKQH